MAENSQGNDAGFLAVVRFADTWRLGLGFHCGFYNGFGSLGAHLRFSGQRSQIYGPSGQQRQPHCSMAQMRKVWP